MQDLDAIVQEALETFVRTTDADALEIAPLARENFLPA